MMKYKMIIFDWDGCLFASNLTLLSIVKEILAKEGSIIPEELVIKDVIGNWEAGFEKYGVSDIKNAIDTVYSELSERLYTTSLFKGVKGTLSALKKAGVKNIISSPTNSGLVAPHMDRLGIIPHVEAMLTDRDFGYGKTETTGIDKVVKEFNVPKKEVLYVGNSPKDVLFAKLCGLDCLIYYPKENHKFYAKKEFGEIEPKYIVDNFSSVADIVLGN